jgi:prolipoprotein diacylglyceryltransferase
VALILYARKTKVKFMHALDNISIATPLTAGCIRLGNLMNSEIVGKATGSDWGFIFAANGETFPRHPGQLYEAIAYLVFFFVGLWLYRRRPESVGSGFFFGYCLFSIFSFRLFVEMFKEVQEAWELSMQAAIGLNQGQMLSVPFILLGGYFLFFHHRKAKA